MLETVTGNELADLLKIEKIVIADLFTTWCGPCKMQHKILEKISAEFDGKIKFVELDLDKNENISKIFDVHAVPTVLIFLDNKRFKFKTESKDVPKDKVGALKDALEKLKGDDEKNNKLIDSVIKTITDGNANEALLLIKKRSKDNNKDFIDSITNTILNYKTTETDKIEGTRQESFFRDLCNYLLEVYDKMAKKAS